MKVYYIIPLKSLLNCVGGLDSWVGWVAWVRGWRGSNFGVGGVGSVGP